MVARGITITLLVAALIASAACCQTFNVSRDKTLQLNWHVTSKPDSLLVDPNPELTLSNALRIGANLGLGYYTFQSGMVLQYDLRARFAARGVALSVGYENRPVQLLQAQEGQTVSRGLAASAAYSVSSDLAFRTDWFFGAVKTANFSAPDGYYGTLVAQDSTWFDYRDKLSYDLAFSLAGSPSTGTRRYAAVFSTPFSLSQGDVQIAPLVGYLENSLATKSYLDDLTYDYSTFTFGPLTSGITGNSIAALSAQWKLHPFRRFGIFPFDSLYVGPVVNGALVWSSSSLLNAPEAAITAGGMIGFMVSGISVEFEAGYRSDTNGHFVWTFAVY